MRGNSLARIKKRSKYETCANIILRWGAVTQAHTSDDFGETHLYDQPATEVEF